MLLYICVINIPTLQEVRDEEAEWTDYDADELAVKFRLSDTIFECLLRETLAVYSAIDQREISS